VSANSTGRSLRTRPACTLAAATLLVIGVTACGTSTPRQPASSTGRVRTQTTTVARFAPTAIANKSRLTPASGPLAYAECMRAHGVTNFPDPSPGGGFAFKTGSGVVASPAFQTAQARCQKFMGGAPGFETNPSKETMTKLLRIARCMRAHGVHQFPDPLYSRPRHFTPGEYQEITDFDGATLLFPTSMNLQAPAYRQALNACGAPPLGLPH
jgi:hypothetical protein